MIDIHIIRETPEIIRKDLERRDRSDDLKLVDEIRKKDTGWRNLKTQVEDIRAQRNKLARDVAETKKAKQNADKLIAKSKELADDMADREQKMELLEKEIRQLLMKLPNILHESVPQGADETQNVVVKESGKKNHIPKPLSHVDLMDRQKWADFDRAGKIAGARFYFLKGDLVLLEQALIKYALDFMSDKEFTPVEPPFMMTREAYEGVTDLGDFEQVMYKVDGENLHLIATSEHPLTAMYMDEILEPEMLPIKMVGISPCFRKEAGAHGKDTKGIFRVHQFNKIEQIVICKPEDSWKFHEEILKNAEEFFTSLGIPYRVLNMCTGDIGTVAAKKYDIEAWFPCQDAYREVVSCSNCTDYQARRLQIRMRGNKGNITVHTLNSTVVATTRALVAIMENYQEKDGRVGVPKVLQPYMNGRKFIGERV